MDNSSKVIKALKMLQDEGREELLQEGVLEQAWASPERFGADKANAGCGYLCKVQAVGGAAQSLCVVLVCRSGSVWLPEGEEPFVKSVVAEEGRLGDCTFSTQAPVVARVVRASKKQAILPSEITSDRGEGALEERPLGVALKMAAPAAEHRDVVLVVSDEEVEEHMGKGVQFQVLKW
ncbi:hypothetical protein NDU88_002447 [Pleurodeles waltl]|uniref:Uncharacterized protein n=1 Tax=Pleurodeles waltl TaxID=8319 RepID=A0AAV7KW51_PLEWA|nr:hypothetical protein NDU88_002447 [Pleurodeles waltl]